MIRLVGIFFILLIAKTGNAQSLKISIAQLGAKGVKSQDATPFIQQAIDSCYNAGGGMVILPPGNYTSTTLFLKSRVTLHLEAGAALFASTNPNAYRNIPADENPMLIFANKAKDITIEGEGKVVGQPEYVMEPYNPSDMTERAYRIAVENGLSPMAPVRKVPPISLITLSDCKNVSVSGITLANSPFWALHIRWSNKVSIKHVRIFSNLNMGVNSDGIDIDGSKNVTISDCVISTADDAIALKTTLFNGRHRACKNITVKNCRLTSTSCALKIGTESYDDFRHIYFYNNIIRNTNRG
ncbi:MAG TPA: glycosyl hydrolase family 28 protein, partial [Balneolaceae bacterium]|nr:glycosyl hydrolase family 28 protein [Balneolaceae bacterium]